MKGDPIEVMRRDMYDYLDSSLGDSDKIERAIRYSVLGSPGHEKQGHLWRPLITLGIARDYRVDDSTAFPLAAAQECAHVASLIYDDVLDDDDVRHGQPSCHVAHGLPVALFAVLQLLGRGRRFIKNSGLPAELALDIIDRGDMTTDYMTRGELKESEKKVYRIKDAVNVYKEKTSSLFALAAYVGAAASNASPKEKALMQRIATELGIVFQMADDAKDRNHDRGKKKTIFDVVDPDDIRDMWYLGREGLENKLSELDTMHRVNNFGMIIRSAADYNKEFIDALVPE